MDIDRRRGEGSGAGDIRQIQLPRRFATTPQTAGNTKRKGGKDCRTKEANYEGIVLREEIKSWGVPDWIKEMTAHWRLSAHWLAGSLEKGTPGTKNWNLLKGVSQDTTNTKNPCARLERRMVLSWWVRF